MGSAHLDDDWLRDSHPEPECDRSYTYTDGYTDTDEPDPNSYFDVFSHTDAKFDACGAGRQPLDPDAGSDRG
jgi:hypothetical protein